VEGESGGREEASGREDLDGWKGEPQHGELTADADRVKDDEARVPEPQERVRRGSELLESEKTIADDLAESPGC